MAATPHLDVLQEAARSAATQLSQLAHAEWGPPQPARWTAQQVLDHLRRSARGIEALLDGAPADSEQPAPLDANLSPEEVLPENALLIDGTLAALARAVDLLEMLEPPRLAGTIPLSINGAEIRLTLAEILDHQLLEHFPEHLDELRALRLEGEQGVTA